jgi:hypothetical protein
MTSPGRPTAYRREFCELALNYCLLGATNAELAGFLDVAPRTIDNWIASHPAFAEAVREGRVVADARVARCLYERAVGYSCTVERTVLHDGAERTLKNVVRYPPDTRACIFWLRNRQRTAWAEKAKGRPDDDSGGAESLLAALDAAGERARAEALEKLPPERRRSDLLADAALASGGPLLEGEPDAEPARADEYQVDAEEDAERVGAGVGPLGDDDDAQQQGDQGRDSDPTPRLAGLAHAPGQEAAHHAADHERDAQHQGDDGGGLERPEEADDARRDIEQAEQQPQRELAPAMIIMTPMT